ncbi:hypothetical protein Nepgr_001561 [Nepenthes gracilis]|uniref:RanBP2-type domain-containing protein n=1 Tax=Nepenthes gracilis TaxID=150966 RepID=A0AAD3P8P9_NEPGR|nr:hypothetical protein Nepgr_001561 [Nepenthes gracilis]
MAPSPFSLILRHLSKNPKPHNYINHFLSPVVKQLSLSSHLQSDRIPNIADSPKPSSLSARLGFIFDQIDQIEKERAEKDEALQRIKAWRESKNSRQQAENNVADSKRFENEQLRSGNSTAESKLGGNLIDPSLGGLKGEQEELTKKEVELVHPWPEWIEFMERLVQQNYFDHKRKDEDKMIEGLGFDMSEVAEEGFDFTRDWKTVQTAILNFGRDRFDILRSLSRHDIQVLVGYGCPSMDKKVVFSAKLLRKHVHLDEGDVCSSCSLRSSCEKAYLLTNKEDEARTIDVVRVLLTYGFDPISESVVNKSLLKQKSVKTVVRKLLHEVVKLSSVPIDPNLPPPLIKKRPPKVKQPPPPPKKRVGRDDIEMKKGDWLCPKCDFMNFAKNLDCLQCDAKRPKRQLLPGEWECPQCNFLNYRRNMACFHCEHKRPPDEYMENQAQERQRRPNARLDRVASRQEVSNAWNFDFDDDESDGADVAAFEFADSHGSGAGNPSINQTENASLSGHEGDVCRTGTLSRAPENEYASFVKRKQHRVGFDDFSDEDDDGIDSYEIDNQPKNKRQEASSVRFSDVEGSSDSEGDDYFPRYHGRSSGRSSCSYDKPHIRPRGKGALSSSCGEDLDIDSTHDLPVHPKWKSSHVADSRPSKQMSFSSDEDLGLTSDSDDDLMGISLAGRTKREVGSLVEGVLVEEVFYTKGIGVTMVPNPVTLI